MVSVFPRGRRLLAGGQTQTLIDMDLKIPTQLRKGVDKTAPSEVTSHKLWTV